MYSYSFNKLPQTDDKQMSVRIQETLEWIYPVKTANQNYCTFLTGTLQKVKGYTRAYMCKIDRIYLSNVIFATIL